MRFSVYVDLPVHVNVHVHLYLSVSVYVRVAVHVHMWVHTHTSISHPNTSKTKGMYTRIHMCVYMYICTQILFLKSDVRNSPHLRTSQTSAVKGGHVARTYRLLCYMAVSKFCAGFLLIRTQLLESMLERQMFENSHISK